MNCPHTGKNCESTGCTLNRCTLQQPAIYHLTQGEDVRKDILAEFKTRMHRFPTGSKNEWSKGYDNAIKYAIIHLTEVLSLSTPPSTTENKEGEITKDYLIIKDGVELIGACVSAILSPQNKNATKENIIASIKKIGVTIDLIKEGKNKPHSSTQAKIDALAYPGTKPSPIYMEEETATCLLEGICTCIMNTPYKMNTKCLYFKPIVKDTVTEGKEDTADWTELRDLWREHTTLPVDKQGIMELEQFLLGYKHGFIRARQMSSPSDLAIVPLKWEYVTGFERWQANTPFGLYTITEKPWEGMDMNIFWMEGPGRTPCTFDDLDKAKNHTQIEYADQVLKQITIAPSDTNCKVKELMKFMDKVIKENPNPPTEYESGALNAVKQLKEKANSLIQQTGSVGIEMHGPDWVKPI